MCTYHAFYNSLSILVLSTFPCPLFRSLIYRFHFTILNPPPLFKFYFLGAFNVVAPNIIIDLKACTRPIYGDLDLICGGQGKLYEERWAAFLSALESAGIEPLFVTDGSCVPSSKRKKWVERKYDALDKFVTPIFDALVIHIFCRPQV